MMYWCWAILILAVITVNGYILYGVFCISSQIFVKATCHLQTKEKKVALTFDDGPDENTPAVLDVLKKHQAKAIFFCIGAKAEKNPRILQQIEAEGHLIGNHSYCHSGIMPFWPTQRIREDYEKSDKVLQSILHHPIAYFRPPIGVTNPHIKKALDGFNYEVIGWDIRSFDTNGASSEVIKERVMRQVKSGSIILLHDRLPQTATTLEMIMTELEKQDYKVVRIDQI